MLIRALALLYLSVFIFGVWSCRHGQDLSKAVERDFSIHDKGYKNSRIIDIDFDRKLVQVLTFEAPRMDIVFEAGDEFLAFMKGNSKAGLLPVTFVCGKKPNEECNLNKPYVLYVGTREVKPILVQKNKNSGP